MSERIVLCEGYYDRAFWKGALEVLKCVDPGNSDPSGDRKPVYDPGGKIVSRGQYAFHTPSGKFVRVVPCHGKKRVLPELRRKLRDLSTVAIELIVVNWDDDSDAREQTSPAPFPQVVRDAVLSIDPSAQPIAGGLSLRDDTTRVLLTSWRTEDAHTIALPWKQTLERLVASALDAAYPGRGHAVGTWLAGLPQTDGHKPHAWSHMAGWFAEHGGEGFYRLIWDNPAIHTALVERLKACGAWNAMEQLAQ